MPCRKFALANQKHYPDLSTEFINTALISQTSLHWETSSGVASVSFFSQPTPAVSISKGIECTCNDSAVGFYVEKWSSITVVLYHAVHHENTQVRLSNC